MKIISFIFALVCATAAYAKTDAGDFNRAILEGIKAETKSDGDSFRVQSRAPASVEVSAIEKIENQKKSVDKMEKNYKQVGQPQW
jgi:hypothetical protein